MLRYAERYINYSDFLYVALNTIFIDKKEESGPIAWAPIVKTKDMEGGPARLREEA